MSLTDVIAAVREVVVPVQGVGQVYDDPLPALTPDRSVVVYAVPGDATPADHRGRNGGIVIQKRDRIAVEYHRRVAAKDWATVLADVNAMTDTLRDALWRAFAASRFDGSVVGLASITTDQLGELEWGPTFVFGSRQLLDVLQKAEV